MLTVVPFTHQQAVHMKLLWFIFKMRPMNKMLAMKSKRKKMMIKKKGTMRHTKVVVPFLYPVRQ